MSGTPNKRRLSLAAGILLAALTLGLKASAEPRWLPTELSLRAEQRGETCSVLRSLQQDQKRFAAESQSVLESQIRDIKGLRTELENCGRSKGISANGGDLSESAMAEFCGPLFSRWIHKGYQIEMVRQDLMRATKDLGTILAKVSVDCPTPRRTGLPEKTAQRESAIPLGLRRAKGREEERVAPHAAPRKTLRTAWLRGNELPQ
jgi:hypothetical protein